MLLKKTERVVYVVKMDYDSANVTVILDGLETNVKY